MNTFKVKCIDNGYVQSTLKLGKIYTVQEEDFDYYGIEIGGLLNNFLKYRFEKVEEEKPVKIEFERGKKYRNNRTGRVGTFTGGYTRSDKPIMQYEGAGSLAVYLTEDWTPEPEEKEVYVIAGEYGGKSVKYLCGTKKEAEETISRLKVNGAKVIAVKKVVYKEGDNDL